MRRQTGPEKYCLLRCLLEADYLKTDNVRVRAVYHVTISSFPGQIPANPLSKTSGIVHQCLSFSQLAIVVILYCYTLKARLYGAIRSDKSVIILLFIAGFVVS